jgi:hypothetical protein
MRAKARAAQIDVIDLGMGNPDGATPRVVVNKLIEAARNPRNHRYSQSRGIPRLREEIARGTRATTAWSSTPTKRPSSPSAPRTRWRTCSSPPSVRATWWSRRTRHIPSTSTAS